MKSSSGYEIYHNTLSSVLDEIERYVQSKGYEVGDYFPLINHVSYGTTEKADLELLKNGRLYNNLKIQIYRMESGKYELNCYPVRNFQKGNIVDKFALGGKVLWGVKKGDADWKEQIITENEQQIENAKKWAVDNGFDRFRIQMIDLSTPPDFKKTFKNGGGIDYRGEHKAPSREDEDAPLHKLELIYPEDIYSSNAVKYYGTNGGDAMDRESISIMQSARNKPNKPIKIYRAVPDINFDISKQLKELNSIIIYNDKWKFFPSNNKLIYFLQDKYSIDDYSYDKQKELILEDINNQINSLESKLQKTIGINNNDWVTINRAYAKEHGESNLNNQYKILSKQVKASELFTDGNSIHEFGYSAETPKMAKGGGIESVKVGNKYHYKFDNKNYEVLAIENSKVVIAPIPLGSFWNNREISFSLMNKWIIEKTMVKI
jgi:hypothetical protein